MQDISSLIMLIKHVVLFLKVICAHVNEKNMKALLIEFS